MANTYFAGQRITAAMLNGVARRAYGSFNVNVAGGGTNVNTAVVFPAGLFSAAPHVNVIVGNGRLDPAISLLTASGCTIGIVNWTASGTGVTTVWWEAVEIV